MTHFLIKLCYFTHFYFEILCFISLADDSKTNKSVSYDSLMLKRPQLELPVSYLPIHLSFICHLICAENT